MAEYLLRQRLEQAGGWRGTVRSAGIAALVAHPADEDSIAVMREHGVDLTPHHAAQISSRDLRQSDLVLVMEKHHRDAVLDLDPTARGKTFLLGHWTQTEVPDPYRRGRKAHAEALRLIEVGLQPWLERLGIGS